MSNIFQKLELAAFRNQITPRTKESREWFMNKAKTMRGINREELMKEEPLSRSGRRIIGSMQMFGYDPQHKDTLLSYDRFPLAIIVKPAKGGFLGINFHYLPIPLRMKLFETLEKRDFKGDYRALKNVREIKPTIKHYLRSQMASKFLRLDEEDFASAIFLPVQDFRKAGASTVHAASRRMI